VWICIFDGKLSKPNLVIYTECCYCVMSVWDRVCGIYRAGELCRADGVIRDVSGQIPWCVWYSAPTVHHCRHISVKCVRHAQPTWSVHI